MTPAPAPRDRGSAPAARAVPLLPCRSIHEAAELARDLGFSIAYRQDRPRPYVALRGLGGLELHYFQVPDHDAATSQGACLLAVPDPRALLDRWSRALVRRFGQAPTRGFPRLLVPADDSAFVGFSLVDVAGNRIRVVRNEVDVDDRIEVVEQVAGQLELPEPPPPPEGEPVLRRPGPSLPPPDPASAVTLPAPTRATDESGGPASGDPASGPSTSGPSAFERHGVAAAPHHRLAALLYLAELSVRLGRLDDARSHLRAAEAIDPDSHALADVRAALEQREGEA